MRSLEEIVKANEKYEERLAKLEVEKKP